jgi:hypothetical protein
LFIWFIILFSFFIILSELLLSNFRALNIRWLHFCHRLGLVHLHHALEVLVKGADVVVNGGEVARSVRDLHSVNVWHDRVLGLFFQAHVLLADADGVIQAILQVGTVLRSTNGLGSLSVDFVDESVINFRHLQEKCGTVVGF